MDECKHLLTALEKCEDSLWHMTIEVSRQGHMYLVLFICLVVSSLIINRLWSFRTPNPNTVKDTPYTPNSEPGHEKPPSHKQPHTL